MSVSDIIIDPFLTGTESLGPSVQVYCEVPAIDPGAEEKKIWDESGGANC